MRKEKSFVRFQSVFLCLVECIYLGKKKAQSCIVLTMYDMQPASDGCLTDQRKCLVLVATP